MPERGQDCLFTNPAHNTDIDLKLLLAPLQIIQSLDEDPAAQNKQLTLRLQQIAAALENKVTDLWHPTYTNPTHRGLAVVGVEGAELANHWQTALKDFEARGWKKGRGRGECDQWNKMGGANNAIGSCWGAMWLCEERGGANNRHRQKVVNSSEGNWDEKDFRFYCCQIFSPLLFLLTTSSTSS